MINQSSISNCLRGSFGVLWYKAELICVSIYAEASSQEMPEELGSREQDLGCPGYSQVK